MNTENSLDKMSEIPLPKIKATRQKLRKLFEQRGFMPESDSQTNLRPRVRDNEIHNVRNASIDEILNSLKYVKDVNLPCVLRPKKSPLCSPVKQPQDDLLKIRSKEQLSNDNKFIDNLSRDISHMRDKKERSKSQLRSSERQLKEILGLKQVQIQQEMPLPIDIQEVESLLMNDETNGEYLVDFPLLAVQEDEKEETFDDKMHENFIHDLINAKKAYYEHHNQKRSETQKDSVMFSTLIPKLYGLNTNEITNMHKRAKSSKTFDRKLIDHTLNQLEEKIVEWNTEEGRTNAARGPPSGRREVELLEKWLDYMLDLYVENAEHYTHDQRARATQMIYTLCFKEVIRQVGVHCAERGRLLDRIWKASMNMYSKHENSFIQQIDELKVKFKEIVHKSQKKYESNLDVAAKKYSEINAELRKTNRTNDEMSKQNRILNLELEESKVRNKQLREAIDVLMSSSKEKSLIKPPSHFEETERFQHKFNKTSPTTRSITTSTFEDFDRIVSAALNPAISLGHGSHQSQSTVLIQGYFDKANNFHRTRQFQKDSEGNIVGVDYGEDIVSLVETQSKGTDTSRDELLKIMFLTEEECRYIWDRMICMDNLDNCSLGYKPGQGNLHEKVDRWKLRLLYGFERIVENIIQIPSHVKNRNASIQVPECDDSKVHSTESSYVKSDSDDDIKIVSYNDTYNPQTILNSSESPTQHISYTAQSLKNLTSHIDDLKSISERVLLRADEIQSRNLFLNDPIVSSLHIELLQAWSIINEDVFIIQNLKNMLQRNESCSSSEISSEYSDSASECSDIDQDLIIDIAMRMGPLIKMRDSTTKEEVNKIHNSNALHRIIKLSSRYDKEVQRYGKNNTKSNYLLKLILKSIKRAKYTKVKESSCQTDVTWEMVHVRSFLVAKTQTLQKLILRSFEKKDDKDERKHVESLISASDIEKPARLKKEVSIKEDEQNSMRSTPKDNQKFRLSTRARESQIFNMFSIVTASYAKRPHPASQLIAKTLASNMNKSRVLGSFSIKRLSKIITNSYVTRIISIRENAMIKRVPLHEMLYDDLNKKYGLKNMTDIKMKEIIYSSIANVDKSIKVHNFMKFMGLFEDYTVGDLNHYIGAFEFLAINTSGQLEIDEYGLDNQVHISKAHSCAKVYFEEKLPKAEWEKMKLDIESLKEVDVKLKSATKIKLPADKVSIDKLLSMFILYFQNMKSQVHMKICEILNDEVPTECGFSEEEFLNLVFKLNSDKSTREELSNLFGVFGDFIIGEESGKASREKMILLEHVLTICVDLGLIEYDSSLFYKVNSDE